MLTPIRQGRNGDAGLGGGDGETWRVSAFVWMLFTLWWHSLQCPNFHETCTRQNYIQFSFTQLTQNDSKYCEPWYKICVLPLVRCGFDCIDCLGNLCSSATYIRNCCNKFHGSPHKAFFGCVTLAWRWWHTGVELGFLPPPPPSGKCDFSYISKWLVNLGLWMYLNLFRDLKNIESLAMKPLRFKKLFKFNIQGEEKKCRLLL
jgi:hypothetical protein